MNKINQVKPFIRFGLITGFLVGMWNLSCFTIVGWINRVLSLDIPATRIRAYSGLFGLVILAIGIFLGINEKKRREKHLTYKAAIKTGISIALISAVVVSFFSFIYCTVINPGYTEFMVKQTQQALVAANRNPEEISRAVNSAKSFYSPASQAIQALIVQSVFGTIASLITGLFLRSKISTSI